MLEVLVAHLPLEPRLLLAVAEGNIPAQLGRVAMGIQEACVIPMLLVAVAAILLMALTLHRAILAVMAEMELSAQYLDPMYIMVVAVPVVELHTGQMGLVGVWEAMEVAASRVMQREVRES